VREMLRPAVFIPESKPLNVLLREFRANRNHMAIVVDEYGGVAGLITIEDVLEQIVGDIEDEYDFDEAADNILAEGRPLPRQGADRDRRLQRRFGTTFSDDEFDTVGGLVTDHFGRVPKRGDRRVTRRHTGVIAKRRHHGHGPFRHCLCDPPRLQPL
jgi:magnesium and cobalt transporter